MKPSEIFNDQLTDLKNRITTAIRLLTHSEKIGVIGFDKLYVEAIDNGDEVQIVGLDATVEGIHAPLIIKKVGTEVVLEQIDEFDVLELIWILKQLESKKYAPTMHGC